MTIKNPDSQFRVIVMLWTGNHKGEQPFYSAAQKNLLNAITMVQQLHANKAIDSQVRSYRIQEDITPEKGRSTWRELDYSDWCDLAWPPKPAGPAPGIVSAREQNRLGINTR